MTQENEFWILIIDDNSNIYQELVKILIPECCQPEPGILEETSFDKKTKASNSFLPPFRIDTASQAQEGIERIKMGLKTGKPYTLAFINMDKQPEWGDVEIIKHIWDLDPDIQIVIYKAYSNSAWEEIIQKLVMNDNLLILENPLDRSTVRQFAIALTKKWQLIQKTRTCIAFFKKNLQKRTSELQHALSATRAIINSFTDGIIIVDNKRQIIDYNKRFIAMWKISESFIDKKDYSKIFNYMMNQVKNSHDFLDSMKTMYFNSEELNSNIFTLQDNRVFECFSQPYILNNKTIGYVWNFRDVTKRIEFEKKLERQATHDALTELPNRALLVDRIQQAILRANRIGKIFSVLFFDLNHFKLVNDSISHAIGDKLLQMVAQRVRTAFRSEDTVARLGGDEFVMVMIDLNNDKAIMNIITKLLNLFKDPFNIERQKIFITASVGVASYPKDGRTPEELISKADLAMYFAKEQGNNQFQFFTTKLNQLNLVRLKKGNKLHYVIEKNEFFCFISPNLI